uniref:Uncharacterized protein n=1 Tax=Timema cristinae TaxID=61476 RepID=A0A7R9DFY7_TIMCR|nr:unnamed protein product [Timema cristinae]
MFVFTDYEQFVEILTQRPFKLSNFAISRLNEQAMKYLTEIARNRFDNIMLTLETMPRTLLLVIRNLNTIRAIGREHGDPVNRYMVMARIATKGAFISRDTRMCDRLAGVVQLCYFEFKLWYDSVKQWTAKFCWRLLTLLGRVPESLTDVMDHHVI